MIRGHRRFLLETTAPFGDGAAANEGRSYRTRHRSQQQQRGHHPFGWGQLRLGWSPRAAAAALAAVAVSACLGTTAGRHERWARQRRGRADDACRCQWPPEPTTCPSRFGVRWTCERDKKRGEGQ